MYKDEAQTAVDREGYREYIILTNAYIKVDSESNR